MNYQTFQPGNDLNPLVKCHWTLEVPAEFKSEKQKIVPDGCMELIFILGDDIKRYTSETDYIIQPRSIVVGQLTEPFTIQPVGYVHCFGTRFYPYGMANFIPTPLKNLENKETPIAALFGQATADALTQKIIHAGSTAQRIELIEAFLQHKLNEKTTIDHIVKSTVDALLETSGSTPIKTILKDDLSKRRQLERKFLKQIGMSPKQLGKVVRLQTALKLLLDQKTGTFTEIAYESEYYDQNHFIKDFKEFTGTTPKEFLADEQMLLSSLFYKPD
ncbi:MAG: helix-turn-helix domain-containing protein [Taibaiella sp.]|nr:helix-turn-helix domain-containing protein [Taibaiella sp.]